MNTTTLKISLRKLKILLPLTLVVPTHDGWKKGKSSFAIIQTITNRANEMGLSDFIESKKGIKARKKESTCMPGSERTQRPSFCSNSMLYPPN